MGELVEYFQGLKKGAVIDEKIITVLKVPTHMQYYVNDLTEPSRDNWKFSRIGSYEYNYVFVPWVENSISYGYVNEGSDFISRPFSGCYMAIYNQNGQRCGSHIHKGGEHDQAATWNTYSNKLVECTLFKPNIDFAFRYPKNCPEVWGIIADDDKCYTVIVSKGTDIRFLAICKEPSCINKKIN